METRANGQNGENSKARAALVEAATTLFAEYGYSATSVQQITGSAGINKAMLYYYFASKEDLYGVILEEGISAFDRAVASAENDGPEIRNRLKNLLTTYLSVVAEQPDLARVVYREALGVGESARQTVADHFRKSVERLAALLSEAQAAGELRGDVEPTLSAYSLFGMANMFISRVVVNRRELDVPALVEHISDVFFKGVEQEKQIDAG